MRWRMYTCVLILSITFGAGAITPQEILDKLDQNRDFSTIVYNGTMEIHIGDEVRTKTMKTKAIGQTKAIVEFANPQDHGVKYLKINKDLWIYFPSEQDVVKISGHMLKEGMMGSDVSYEDALEADAVRKKYRASITGEDTLDGKKCRLVTLEAIVKDAPYYKRVMWVDEELFIARKEQMYAKSGKLLKESRVLEWKKFAGRNFPVTVEMVNKLRRNSKTIFKMTDIELNIPLDEKQFSLQYLQR